MFEYKFNEQQIKEYNNIKQQQLINTKKIGQLIDQLIIKCPIDKVVLSNKQNSLDDDIVAYYLVTYNNYIHNYLYNENIPILQFIVNFKKYLMAESNYIN